MLWGVCAYHLMLLCTLLCVALIEFDGQRVPFRLFAVPMVVGIASPLIWPELRPVVMLEVFSPLRSLGGPDMNVNELYFGFGFGGWFGAASTPATMRSRDQFTVVNGMIIGALCGTYLGGPAILGVSIGTAAVFLLVTVVGRFWAPAQRVPWSAALLTATLIWILAWKPLMTLIPPIGVESLFVIFLITQIIVALAFLATWVIAPVRVE